MRAVVSATRMRRANSVGTRRNHYLMAMAAIYLIWNRRIGTRWNRKLRKSCRGKMVEIRDRRKLRHRRAGDKVMGGGSGGGDDRPETNFIDLPFDPYACLVQNLTHTGGRAT